MAKKQVSWLEKLEEQLDVDVDWMDPDYIKSLPIKPHDQTSNQISVHVQMSHDSNRELLLQTARELKDQGWLAIYTRMACLMCKKNMDLISGRLLLQTSPSAAYNKDKTIEHARLYDREFARVGISRDRYCIKIPSTGPGLCAAKVLSREGIPTLGTALFGLPQAVAASQAGCLFISPYFNEIRAHEDRKVWKDYEDPAAEHPMSARVFNILEIYRRLYRETGKEQPFLKNASFISVKEAMACAHLGCHSATLSTTTLDELAKLPYDSTQQPCEVAAKPAHVYKSPNPTLDRIQKLANTDPISAGWDPKTADTSIDYLADEGARLDDAIAADPITTKRLKDALEVFVKAEERSKARVEEALKE